MSDIGLEPKITEYDKGAASKEHLEKLRADREFYTELGREILTNRSPQMFIDFDVEGDGPAGFGSVCSIGAVAPTSETFYIEIQPQTMNSLTGPREFCDKLGLTREYLEQNGVSVDEAGRQFKRWVDELKHKYDKPAVAVAFNAGYDWAHIDLVFAKAANRFPDDFPSRPGSSQPSHNPFGIAPFDTKSLSMALPREDRLGINWNWSDTSKNHLPVTVNPETEFTHNALDDAIYQQKQHFAMVGLLNIGKNPELDAIIRNRIADEKRALMGEGAVRTSLT